MHAPNAPEKLITKSKLISQRVPCTITVSSLTVTNPLAYRSIFNAMGSFSMFLKGVNFASDGA